MKQNSNFIKTLKDGRYKMVYFREKLKHKTKKIHSVICDLPEEVAKHPDASKAVCYLFDQKGSIKQVIQISKFRIKEFQHENYFKF